VFTHFHYVVQFSYVDFDSFITMLYQLWRSHCIDWWVNNYFYGVNGTWVSGYIRPQWSSGSMLTTGTKIFRFKLGWGQWIFKGDKNPLHNFFGGEVKLLVPCCKILPHIKEPTSMKEILHRQNSVAISHQVSPALLLGTSTGNCQRALVDKSGTIRNQMQTYNRSDSLVHPPHYSNSKSIWLH
jgi:hypothetical protein